MDTVTHTISYSPRDIFTIYPLYDVHIGAMACDEKLLERRVQEILDNPLAFWIGGGDYCDFIPRHDRRYRASGVAKWARGHDDIVRAQLRQFVEIVKPIRHKCLLLIKGNHEDSIAAHYERDIYAEIVENVATEVPQEQYSGNIAPGVTGYMVINFKPREGGKAWRFTAWCHHGYGGGRYAGAKVLNLERELALRDANVVLVGHTHARAVWSGATTSAKGYSQPKGAVCGSFFRSYGSFETYASRKGYPPGPIDTVPLFIVPDTREFYFQI
jgi:hypothetical protein